MNNAISWFQIPAVDFSRALEFYGVLLNQKIAAEDFMGVPQGVFPYDYEKGGVGGAVIPADGSGGSSAERPIVYLYVGEQLAPVLARVTEAGGTVLVPQASIGDLGVIAVIRDTEGNHVGLHAKS